MTKQELDAIRARCTKATSAPWKWHCYATEANDATGEDRFWIGSALWDICEISTYERIDEPAWRVENDEADAAFIAHARQDIPALLAEIDRLRDLLNRADLLIEDLAPVTPS